MNALLVLDKDSKTEFSEDLKGKTPSMEGMLKQKVESQRRKTIILFGGERTLTPSAQSAMKTVYRVLAVLGVTAALAVALAVVWIAHTAGFWSWASAFCATWFVLAWVATLHLLICIRLPEWYFHSKGFEKSGRVYKLLGVLLLRKLVWRGPIHVLAPALRYSGRRESLPALERETRKAESAHGLAFLASLLLLAYALYNECLNSAGWLLLFNILLNVYPMMLQRYNRVRLEKLLQKSPPNQPLQQTRPALLLSEPSSQAARPGC